MLIIFFLLLVAIHCAQVEDASPLIASPEPRMEPFPILASYYQPSCRAIWFSLIDSIIEMHVIIFRLHQRMTIDRIGPEDEVRAADFESGLWQVFAPGSTIAHADIGSMIVLDRMLVEAWRPLKNGDELFTYSSKDAPNAPKETYKLKTPHGVQVSYLMHDVQRDNPILDLFHLSNCEPHLDKDILKLITQHCLVTINPHSIFDLCLSGPLELDEVARLSNLVRALPFPGRFVTAMPMTVSNNTISLEKQIKAGFIPLLDNYLFETVGVNFTLYTLMLQRIVAVAIQSAVYLPCGGNIRQRAALVGLLSRYLRRIFPGSTVKHFRVPSYKAPMSLVFKTQDGTPYVSGFVLDCRPCSSDLMTFLGGGISNVSNGDADKTWNESYTYCALILKFGPPPAQPMTIRDFLWFRGHAFPNVAPLRPRRFAGLSTDIYNDALSMLNATKSIHTGAENFEPIIMECLTMYASAADHYTTIPIPRLNVGLPKRGVHLLRFDQLELHFSETTKFLVNEKVAYPAYTAVAYGEDAIYTIATPFVLIYVRSGDGRGVLQRLVIMKHVDEAECDYIGSGKFLRLTHK